MTEYGAPVPMTEIRDGFWDSFRDTLVREAIPYQWAALNDALPETAEKSGCMRNFRIAAGLEKGDFHGFPFQDSDVYKWLEGVAYSLRWKPDPALEALADGAIETIVKAQQPDGYLDTYYIIRGLSRRWTNLRDDHELYVAGHLIEAAAAYWQATGKRVLLDAAIRFAAHIDSVIGPEEGEAPRLSRPSGAGDGPHAALCRHRRRAAPAPGRLFHPPAGQAAPVL